MRLNTVYIAAGIGALVIALVIFFTYSSDQAKLRGFDFGNNLQLIQDELKQSQNEFYSKKRLLDEHAITEQEFMEFSSEHVKKMEKLLAKYDTLSIPESFVKSVELFRLSTQKQLESDKFLIDWILTNNTANKVRSDLLIQEAFEDEMRALGLFKKAKSPSG